MSFNILEMVKGQLTPHLISKASSFLGESESSVLKAISGILPTVLNGMISKSASPHGASAIFNAAQATNQSGFMDGLDNLFNDGGGMLNKGANILTTLFGDKINGIINTISSFAGIETSSASSLFSMVAPIAASSLGKYAADNKLDADGLASLLGSQKDTVLKMLPEGLGGNNKPKAIYQHADDRKEMPGRWAWLAWFIPLLLAFILVWWFFLGGKANCRKHGAVKTPAGAIHTTAHP
ncbi:MAG: DUF937 domain-containing protein [Chitinophagaceae bacterium]